MLAFIVLMVLRKIKKTIPLKILNLCPSHFMCLVSFLFFSCFFASVFCLGTHKGCSYKYFIKNGSNFYYFSTFSKIACILFVLSTLYLKFLSSFFTILPFISQCENLYPSWALACNTNSIPSQ